jgi:23S rRNA (pseudouridine1915-N3)-methyltransferase
MKLQFWSVGKAHDPYVKEGIELFTKRTSNYYPVEWNIIAPPKNAASLSETDLKKKEGELILGLLQKDDQLFLLDERGKLINNLQLAELIQSKADNGVKSIVFLIGGAFGVSVDIMKRANYTWSMSPLVFPHQLVRLMLAEQVYRACTISRNEKYHHI